MIYVYSLQLATSILHQSININIQYPVSSLAASSPVHVHVYMTCHVDSAVYEYMYHPSCTIRTLLIA